MTNTRYYFWRAVKWMQVLSVLVVAIFIDHMTGLFICFPIGLVIYGLISSETARWLVFAMSILYDLSYGLPLPMTYVCVSVVIWMLRHTYFTSLLTFYVLFGLCLWILAAVLLWWTRGTIFPHVLLRQGVVLGVVLSISVPLVGERVIPRIWQTRIKHILESV